ncbi:MAG: hypothetical protein CVU97_01500 [Firmicutes bacterium HGW-Firmicutes-21]|nr:MAG: hypothetical protein CVU97_01500 [Firmicutes bacterium HGW-Firmicutes-21]
MGKNIMDPGADFTYTQHGVTISKTSDIYSVIGTTPSGLYPFRVVFTIKANSLTSGTYIFGKTLVSGGGSNPTIRLMDRTQTPAVTIVNQPPYSFVISSEGHNELVLEIACNHNTSFNQTFRLQLEKASTATTYEPFVPNKPSPAYPSPLLNAGSGILRSANQEDTAYSSIALPELKKIGEVADTLEYKGNGMWEHIQRIGKHTFTGTENWTKNAVSTDTINVFQTWNVPSILSTSSNTALLMTRFKPSVLRTHGTAYVISGTLICSINVSHSATAADFKTWVTSLHAAGTPLIVQYILATPVTTQLTLGELTTFPHYTSLTQSGNDTLVNFDISAKIFDI